MDLQPCYYYKQEGCVILSTSRKDDHIKIALNEIIKQNRFDDIILVHESLPTLNVEDINLETTFLDFKIPYPFYINAMTGGSETAKAINTFLAKLANHFNVPIVLGSMSNLLKDEALLETYQVVRDHYKGIIVGNLGAGKTSEHVKNVMSYFELDAFSIHLNVIQELSMAEGDRTFSDWQENIKAIVSNIDKPILVKEVGFGMSKSTILKLKALGVKHIDISGKGGTNFAYIENLRKGVKHSFYNTLGIETVDVLLEIKDIEGVSIYASGGIRHALDIIKAFILGAQAVGMSKFFLDLTKKSFDQAVKDVEVLIQDIKKLMVIFNQKTIADLRYVSYQIKP